MNTKPIWLLDVDGVINAVTRDEYPKNSFAKNTWRKQTIAGFPIRWSTDVVDFINDISTRVDVWWHTTWGPAAQIPELVSALRFKDFAVADTSAYFARKFSGYVNTSPFEWWKMQVGVDVLNVEHRPLIWTDDDLSAVQRNVLREATSDLRYRGSCFITPNTAVGLVAADLAIIEAFVSKHES